MAPNPTQSDVELETEPDDAGRTARLIGRNTVWQIGSQVAPAAAALVAIPFLLRRLGPEMFGIVTIFSTVLLYFTMLDLGLGRAATRFIAQSIELARPDDLRRYFWGSIVLLMATGLVASLICLPAVPSLVSKWLKVPPTSVRATIEAFFVLGLAIPVVTLTATFRGFLEASGHFPFVSVVAGCTGVATYLFPAVTVAMGGGLVAIAAAFSLSRVGMCLAFAAGCFWAEGRPSLRPIFDLAAVKRMLSFGGWLSVSNIVGTATVYCDRFLLGVFVGMAAVANYAMPLDLIGRLQILITSFCAVLFPMLSRLDGSGSTRFHTLYRGAIGISLGLMVPLASTVALAAPLLMKIWLGPRSTPEAIFAAQVFLAGAVVQSIASIAWTALHARGRSDLTAWLHLAEFPLYCGLFYFAATHFGVRGAALAWLARGIADCLLMVILLRIEERPLHWSVPPELLAAVISVCILGITTLPWQIAVITSTALCIATWVWTWRAVFEPAMRLGVAKVLLGERAVWQG